MGEKENLQQMLVLDKNYIQKTTDFEKKAVFWELLLRFFKSKARKEDVGSLISQEYLRARFVPGC